MTKTKVPAAHFAPVYMAGDPASPAPQAVFEKIITETLDMRLADTDLGLTERARLEAYKVQMISAALPLITHLKIDCFPDPVMNDNWVSMIMEALVLLGGFKKKDDGREVTRQTQRLGTAANKARAANCRPAIREAAFAEARSLNMRATTSVDFAEAVRLGVRGRLEASAKNRQTDPLLRTDLSKSLGMRKTWPGLGTIRRSVSKKDNA